MDAVLRLERHGGSGAAGLGGDFVAHHFEELQAGVQGFAHQQFEGSFGGFELVALKLHLLDAIEQVAARGVVQPVFQDRAA